MKSLLLIVGFLSLTACSSLVTRGDLKDCQTQCKEKGSCMSHVSKSKGMLHCECELTKEEKAELDKDIQEVSEEMDKMDDAEATPVEIPATEQEIVPAAADVVIAPVESIPSIKSETIPVEEPSIKVDEVQPTPIKVETVPPVAPTVDPEQK